MLQKSPILDPSLRNLSYILRHREWWPEGFEWNFRSCATCAIGMCEDMWGIGPSGLPDADGLVTMDWDHDYRTIFLTTYGKAPLWKQILGDIIPPIQRAAMSAVTPEQVADQIDEFLARKGR